MPLRQQPLLCPHCKRELGFKVYAPYFVHGTAHVVHCPHCHQGLKPEKEPVPTFLCVQFGATFAVVSAVSYLTLIEDHLLHAILFTIALFLLPLAVICVLTYQRIKFVREE